MGYKLPFHVLPGKIDGKNNLSARKNVVFVEEEILNLLRKGCISEVSE